MHGTVGMGCIRSTPKGELHEPSPGNHSAPAPVAKMGRTGPRRRKCRTHGENERLARLHSLMGADSVLYAIAWDNPQTTQPEDCRYDVCLVLPTGPSPTRWGHDFGADCRRKWIRRRRPFPIPPEGVAKAGTSSSRPLSPVGVQPDPSRPILERYAARMINPTNANSVCPSL